MNAEKTAIHFPPKVYVHLKGYKKRSMQKQAVAQLFVRLDDVVSRQNSVRRKIHTLQRVSDTAMHRQAGRHQREREKRQEDERQEESLYNILSLQYVASDVYFKCSCVSQKLFFLGWLLDLSFF